MITFQTPIGEGGIPNGKGSELEGAVNAGFKHPSVKGVYQTRIIYASVKNTTS